MGSAEYVNTGNSIMSIIKLVFGGSFSGVAVIALGGLFPSLVLYALATAAGVWLIARVFRKNHSEVPKSDTILLISILFLVAFLMYRGLAVLSAGGVYSANHSSLIAYEAEKDLLVAAGWLLAGVPHRAFRLGLDRDGTGHAQGVFLKFLVAIAAVLTGISVFLLHFSHGPLSDVEVRPLLVGIFFTVALIVPTYFALARTCWKFGIQKLSPWPLIKHWNEALAELDTVSRGREASKAESSVNPVKEKSHLSREHQLLAPAPIEHPIAKNSPSTEIGQKNARRNKKTRPRK